MLLAAIAVNYAFPWRRYPASLKRQTSNPEVQNIAAPSKLMHADFEYALRELGTYVDVSEADLSRIYRLAVKHAWQISDHSEQISAGLYYSNGEQGAELSVRKVIELSANDVGSAVTFRIVAGYEQGAIATSTLAEFTDWQQYEVILKQGSWHRIRLVGD